jgi:hypothetical protein
LRYAPRRRRNGTRVFDVRVMGHIDHTQRSLLHVDLINCAEEASPPI